MSLTFCLASMILASRSAGMTLPLKEQSTPDYSFTVFCTFTASIVHLSSVLSRITFSVPKPRAAPAFFME